jgi:hypothetical protein
MTSPSSVSLVVVFGSTPLVFALANYLFALEKRRKGFCLAILKVYFGMMSNQLLPKFLSMLDFMKT